MSTPTAPKAPAARAGEIRIKSITFVSKALPIGGVNASADRLEARRDDSPTGSDIFWNPAERHYRIVRYIEGVPSGEFEMHESRIEIRWRWPQ